MSRTPPPLPSPDPIGRRGPQPPALPPAGFAPAAPPGARPVMEIRYSTGKVIQSVLLLGLFAVIVLACGGIIRPRWVGWCLIGVGVLALVVTIVEARKLFATTPVLVFSEGGLLDNSARPDVLLPWAEVRNVTLWTLRVNGVPSTRTLIFDLAPQVSPQPSGPQASGPEDGERRHRIDLDNMKGAPRAIADTVLAWANRGRPAMPMALREGAGEEPPPR